MADDSTPTAAADVNPFSLDLSVGPPIKPSVNAKPDASPAKDSSPADDSLPVPPIPPPGATSDGGPPSGDSGATTDGGGPNAVAPIWRTDNPVGTENLTMGALGTAQSPFDQDQPIGSRPTQEGETRPPSPYDTAAGGIMSRAWWTGLPSRIESAVTGEGRIPAAEQDTPNLFDHIAPKFQPVPPEDVGSYELQGMAQQPAPTSAESALMLTYMLGGRPDQIAASAQKAYPGSRVVQDAQGNPILKMADGARFYISRPGIQAQDVAGAILPTTAAAIASAVPEMAIPLRAAGGFLPSLAMGAVRTAAQAVAQGATQIGQGAVIAGPGGGDTGADPLQVLAAGVGGAGGQVLREVGTLWRSSFGAGGKLISSVGNAADTDPVTPDMLTTTGKQLFQNAGRDPGQLTVGQLKALQTNIRPVTAAVAASGPPAPDMPSPARAAVEQVQYPQTQLTSGTVSGYQPQLNLENRGAFGDAATILRANKATNQDAYLAAQKDLVTKLTGSSLDNEGAQGTQLLQTIRDRAEQNQQATQTAYGKLGPDFTPASESALGPNGMQFVPGNSGLILSDTASAAAGATPELTPFSTQIVKQIRDLVTLPSNSSPSGFIPRGFNLAEYDQTRRTVQDLVNSAKAAWQSGSATGAAKTDYAMATALLGKLDQRVDAAPGLGLATGDTARLGTLRNAQAAASAQAAFANPEDPAARGFMQGALAKNSRTGGYQTYDGQQVVDDMLGKGEIQSNGFTPSIIDHLQTQFAGDPAALQAVRTPGLQRLIAGRNPGTWQQDANPWGSEYTRLQRQIQGAPAASITSRLAAPDQVAEIARLRDLAQTLNQQRALGTSGTSQLGAEMLRRFARTLFLREFVQDPQVAQAQRAVAGRLTPQMFPNTYRPPVTFPLAPAGGLLGSESYRQR